MATDKYLNLQGLTEVASKVNQKLKKVSTIPSNPESGATVLYIGPTNDNFIRGCIYYYYNSEWILLDTSVIINGVNKTGDEASFYAPLDSGELGQVLISGGEDHPPGWSNYTGYAPAFVENQLVFHYGDLPTIDGQEIVFNI